MTYQIEYAYTSHIGKVRANNEDNFWCCGRSLKADDEGTSGVLCGTVPQWKLPLLAVFDGMGGESCGEIAAGLAADSCGRYYRKKRMTAWESPEQFLDENCQQMNQAVCEYCGQNGISSMGATVAMLFFGWDAVYAANLGDSRIYQWHDSRLYQISTDHVMKGGLFVKAPLVQYVGMQEEFMQPEPAIVREPLCEGDRYLLCSDGLTDMLYEEEIAELLAGENSVEDTVDILLEQALVRGGRDNVTIILCEVQAPEKENRLARLLLDTMMRRNRAQERGKHEESDAGSGF